MTQKNLFSEFDLDDWLRGRREQAVAIVNGIQEAQFLISTDEQIVANLLANCVTTPITLHEDRQQFEQKETSVDVSQDRNRFINERSRPFLIPGTEVQISVPFTGDASLWGGRTNPWSSVAPFGDIHGSTLKITIRRPHDAEPEAFKRIYDDNLKNIRDWLARSRTQVEEFNGSLEAPIRDAIYQRRERLKKHKGLADLLNIPLKSKAGAPSIEPLRLEPRHAPPLPSVPRSGLRPEPGIKDADYERILAIIRHEGRSFETTPATFAKHDEEELRDIILAHLNGHFEGGATGETFRRKGKTDICIEDDARSAFVAECKVWRGAGEVGGAIDQLLSYLTWRDSKAAVIIFNTSVSKFSEIPDKLRDAVRAHHLFISEVPATQTGEFRVIMRSAEDEGRRVSVHLFAFNLYAKPTS